MEVGVGKCSAQRRVEEYQRGENPQLVAVGMMREHLKTKKCLAERTPSVNLTPPPNTSESEFPLCRP